MSKITSYQINGEYVTHDILIMRLLQLLEDRIDVRHAYHMGVDIYWTKNAPHWSDPVYLTFEGLEVKGEIIEPLWRMD